MRGYFIFREGIFLKKHFTPYLIRSVAIALLCSAFILLPTDMMQAEDEDFERGDVAEQAFMTDFEDGSLQGWEPRIGEEQLSVTQEDAHSGAYSLLTEGRANSYSGPAVNVTDYLQENNQYAISGWLKMAPGEDPAEVFLSIERSVDGEPSYQRVTGATVTDGEWVQLSGNFDSGSADQFSLYVETAESTSSFYVDDVVIQSSSPPPIQDDIPSLQDVFADHFQIGAAVEPYQMSGRHGEMLEKHYNSLVAENIMKPDAIQPTEGQFNFDASDAMFDFAEEHDMVVRYHTLVWHNQVGDWFFLDEDGNRMVDETDPEKREENKQLLLERMKAHITEVVTRYKGRVDSWDVVNEVIDPGSDDPDGMRMSEWYQIAGKDFIAEAFKLVRELDPDSKLYINDYNSHQPAKRDYLYDLIVELMDEGVPIDGVGHQTHVSIEYPPIHQITESIEMFAELGLDNQITEMDVNVVHDTNDIPQELLIIQAHRYKELFDEFLRLSDVISNVTFWGIGDDHTWLGTGSAPFVFDQDLQAKPA
jgi:endo-1,4-beta-xylanase